MFFTLEERNSRLGLSGVQNGITLPVGNTHHVLHYSPFCEQESALVAILPRKKCHFFDTSTLA